MKISDIQRFDQSVQKLKEIIHTSTSAKTMLQWYIDTNSVLTHGRTSGNVNGFQIVQNLDNRLPTNTPIFIHEYADTIIENVTGHPYRSSSLFTYKNDLDDLVDGRFIVIPIGNNLSCMAINNVRDFYHSISRTYVDVAALVSEQVEHLFEIRPKMSSSISSGVIKYITSQEKDGEPEERSVFAINALKELTPELSKYLQSDNFIRVIHNAMFNEVDELLKDITTINTVGDYERVDDEEIHIYSQQYILIGTGWFENLCDRLNLSARGLLETLLNE